MAFMWVGAVLFAIAVDILGGIFSVLREVWQWLEEGANPTIRRIKITLALGAIRFCYRRIWEAPGDP
ncbi:MAG TPA: hypothetical protein VN886_19405 [Acidimicrobiales bacterium]|nr:hypothetical protein [Acidimicrobiales bacterium]